MKAVLVVITALATLVTVNEAQALRFVDGQYVFDKFDDYYVCQQENYSGVYCLEALDIWLEDNPDDLLKAARAVRKTMNSPAALPYFSKLENLSELCGDEDLTQAVIGGLSLPAQEAERVSQAQKIAFEICYADMKDAIKAELSNSYVFANSCKQLMDKEDMLGSLQKKRCESL